MELVKFQLSLFENENKYLFCFHFFFKTSSKFTHSSAHVCWTTFQLRLVFTLKTLLHSLTYRRVDITLQFSRRFSSCFLLVFLNLQRFFFPIPVLGLGFLRHISIPDMNTSQIFTILYIFILISSVRSSYLVLRLENHQIYWQLIFSPFIRSLLLPYLEVPVVFLLCLQST